MAAQGWEELCGGGGLLDRTSGGGGLGTGWLAGSGGGRSTAAQSCGWGGGGGGRLDRQAVCIWPDSVWIVGGEVVGLGKVDNRCRCFLCFV